MKHFESAKELPKGKYKHVFFDMDNTVTPSRSSIEENMKNALIKLCKITDIVIVSGQTEKRILEQMTNDFKNKISFLAQNGNSAYSSEEGKSLWSRTFSEEERKEVLEHINKVKSHYADLLEQVRKEPMDKLIEDRGCQITFSFVGHNAPLQDKLKFDPNGSIRLKILKEIPLVSEIVEVKVGGTTGFDYIEKGKNKGYNISEWLKHFGWKAEEVLYIGDALFPGGNDDTVLGLCDTLQVAGPHETLAAIERLL